MTRRLGAWDCSYCDTKKILGNVFDCPGCSHPRPRGVRFYQISDGPIVTSKIAKELGSGGPNWYCEHCDSGNKDDSNKCWNCGAPKGSSPSHKVKNYLQGERVPQSAEESENVDPGGKSWVDAVLPVSETSGHKTPANESYTTGNGSGFINSVRDLLPDGLNNDQYKPYAIGVAFVAGLILLSILAYQVFFKTHTEAVRVSSYNWSQSLIVQEYQIVHESSWTTHPLDAYNVTSDYRDTGRDEKVHDGWDTEEYTDTCYETVSFTDTCTGSRYVSDTCTGTRDNGDGSFDTYSYECGGSESYTYSCTNTRQEPYSCTKTRQVEIYHYEDIYDWYHVYDIDKWITIHEYPTQGTDHEPFYYNNFRLTNPYNRYGVPELGQQQQFEIPGTYTVTFCSQGNEKLDGDGCFAREYSLEEWNQFGMGIDYSIEVNYLNQVLNTPVP